MARRDLLPLLLLLGLLAGAALAAREPSEQRIRTDKADIHITINKGADGSESSLDSLPDLSESSLSGSESSLDGSSSESSLSGSESSFSDSESSSLSGSESSFSSESSSESAESESADFSSAQLTKLAQYLLPPEPAAARGYRSLGDVDASAAVSLGDAPELGNGNGVVEAVEAPISKVIGPTFVAQGLGDLSVDSGFMPVRDTQTLARGSCSNPPCSDSLIIVRQVGDDEAPVASSSSSSSSSSSDAPATLQDLPGNCGCDECPCDKYQTPEEKRAKKLEALERRMRTERAAEKDRLHEELEKHQHNLGKIEAMARALRYQYSQLREHHNLLRNHIAANKLNYDKLGGDNPWKGTDLDIEGKMPPVESLDDIGSLMGPSTKSSAAITKTLEDGHARSQKILGQKHQIEKDVAKALMGNKIAA